MKKLNPDKGVTAVTVCLADLDDPAGVWQPDIKTTREQAYRRGFSQGVYAAIEAACGLTDRPEATEVQLLAWHSRLEKWRYKKHKGAFVEPEWLARKPIAKRKDTSP